MNNRPDRKTNLILLLFFKSNYYKKLFYRNQQEAAADVKLKLNIELSSVWFPLVAVTKVRPLHHL